MDYSKSLRHLVRIAFVVGLVVGGVACGDDEDDGSSGAGGTAGMSGGSGGSGGGDSGGSGGGGGSGGSGGSGGGGGSGGSGGMGGGAPMPIMCGSETCNPVPTATGTMLPPCCDEMEGGACGAIVSEDGDCVATGQEGAASDECAAEPNVLMMDTPGCCRPDGSCGLLSGTLMGCIERTRYPAQFLFSMEALTDTTTCTPGDADAGM